MGSWTSFELFSIQSGDKNTLAGWTSDLFYDYNSCSRWGGQEGTITAHLPHVLLQEALIINGDARQGWGKAPLYFKSQHLYWCLRAPGTGSVGLNVPQEDQHLHYTSLFGSIRMRCLFKCAGAAWLQQLNCYFVYARKGGHQQIAKWESLSGQTNNMLHN